MKVVVGRNSWSVTTISAEEVINPSLIAAPEGLELRTADTCQHIINNIEVFLEQVAREGCQQKIKINRFFDPDLI